MTKSEILEAIDATIKSNNKKAINGDSLANILREMTNATPEGSGMITVHMMDFVTLMVLSLSHSTAPTPESTLFMEEGIWDLSAWYSWRQIFANFELAEHYDLMTPHVVEVFELNKVAYQELERKRLASEPAACLLDMSKLMTVSSVLDYEESVPTSATVAIALLDTSSMDEEGNPIYKLTPTANSFTGGSITIKSDGSLVFGTILTSQGYEVHIPSEGELSEASKATNKALLEEAYNNEAPDINDIRVRYVDSIGSSLANGQIRFIYCYINYVDSVYTLDGVYFYQNAFHRVVIPMTTGVPTVTTLNI